MRPFLHASLVLCLFVSSAWAAKPASLVIDADSGAVLHEAQATRRWYPASLTKMMTLYLAFEAMAAKKLAVSDKLTVSAHAASQPPTELGLREGQKISAEDAIRAIIVRSANDAAVTMAEHLAGSEEAFAQRMTDKARALGMRRTVFRNATGLPDEEQTTTARDMAVLARALMRDFPQHYAFFSATSMVYAGHTLPTYNGLLVSYRGAEGLKTGFTCGSGYNVVTSVSRDGRRLIGVLLGGMTREARNGEMARLLDAAFSQPPAAPLGGLDDLPDGDDPDPPHQLSPDGCAGAAVTEGGGATATARPAGWGVMLGAFPREAEARAAIARARTAVTGGRPYLLPRKKGGKTLHGAGLVGLGEPQARAACQALRKKGGYCVVMTPKSLTAAVARR